METLTIQLVGKNAVENAAIGRLFQTLLSTLSTEELLRLERKLSAKPKLLKTALKYL